MSSNSSQSMSSLMRIMYSSDASLLPGGCRRWEWGVEEEDEEEGLLPLQ